MELSFIKIKRITFSPTLQDFHSIKIKLYQKKDQRKNNKLQSSAGEGFLAYGFRILRKCSGCVYYIRLFIHAVFFFSPCCNFCFNGSIVRKILRHLKVVFFAPFSLSASFPPRKCPYIKRVAIISCVSLEWNLLFTFYCQMVSIFALQISPKFTIIIFISNVIFFLIGIFFRSMLSLWCNKTISFSYNFHCHAITIFLVKSA